MDSVEVNEGDRMKQMEDAFLNVLEPTPVQQEDHRAKRPKGLPPPTGEGSQTSSTRDSSPTMNNEWKDQESPMQALRLHLAQALMDLLIKRFETFCKQLTTDSNFMQQSLETGVVLKNGSFPFLKWNPKLSTSWTRMPPTR